MGMDTALSLERVHGGPDAQGAACWDFSSNANACGPCPQAAAAVRTVDFTRYPDPSYTLLRRALARHHGVDVARVLIAASASEFIQRFTAWRWQQGDRQVWVPAHAYGDYLHAALAWGMQRTPAPEAAALHWLCEPGSPLGQSETGEVLTAVLGANGSVVLDCAYAPLRLRGRCALDARALDRVWQLWSPNKALGMTGVRAAYAIAPESAQAAVQTLAGLAPSWPVGGHGQAMLQAWTQAPTQAWLQDSLHTLAAWRTALHDTLQSCGWTCMSSDTAFLCARPPAALDAQALRQRGIKLRDASSFGLPGWWRLSAQAPQTLEALRCALQNMNFKDKAVCA